MPIRLPIIIRIDGKSFHTLLRGVKEPFNYEIKTVIDRTAVSLLKNIQGAVFAFAQSDEINILVINYSSLDYCPWFGNELQKIVSISASIATATFNRERRYYRLTRDLKDAAFDSRAFILPKEEVCNYFIWRQQDWTRNSVQMLARNLYSHKELENKNNEQLQEMIFQKGLNWNDLETWKKRGRCFYKIKTPTQIGENQITPEIVGVKLHPDIVIDNESPIFTQDRQFIDRHVFIEPENDNTETQRKID